MKFSVAWLKRWVRTDLEPEVLAEKLTAGGLEVDSLVPVAEPFTGVVVGQILSCEPHPDADKLQICQVEAGDGAPLQVVCGAPNARAGLKVPFARVGAVLAGGATIDRAELRGVESRGMACSERELGLSDDHSGVLELPDDAPVGQELQLFLELDDWTIALDLTPNRADCLGMKGLSRDVAAILRQPHTPLGIEPVPPTIGDRFEVELVDQRDCPRFACRVIRGVDPTAPTPLWMREALRRSGIRSISAAVDLTNYVLMELGQPMHAYDLDKLTGGITVRMGRAGERLTLLDGKETELNDRLLAICDDSGPVGLGGIMGGLDSGVTSGTTNVLLEAAWFRPATIMGRARELGLQTDASHRFERGVDPTGQVEAIERLTALLLEIAGGDPGPVVLAEAPKFLSVNRPVPLRLGRLNRVLGSELDGEEVERILVSLGMDVTETEEGWEAVPPASRFDIEIEEDLIEEVARIHGYDRLPASLPRGDLELPEFSEQRVPVTQIREALCTAGYQEAITYAFVDHGLLQSLGLADQVLPLANPISSDMDVMRTSLLPGLLKALDFNLRHQQDRVRLFEGGRVFHQREELVETDRIAGVVCGLALPEQWGSEKRRMDYFDIKHDVETLLELRGDDSNAEFRRAGCAWLHPGQAAEIIIDNSNVGWVGAIHPGILAKLDIRPRVFAFELDLDPVAKREIPCAKNISHYPSVRRDLALLVPESVKFSEIKAVVEEITGSLLVDLVVFDQFSGQNVEKGYKSLAIGLILQDVSCTLTDEVVDSLIDRVVKGLESQLDAQLRG